MIFKPNSSPAPSGTPDSISLGEFLKILNAQKILITLLMLLSVVMAVGFTMILPKTYRATCVIRVEKPGGDELFRNRQQAGFDPYFIREQKEIIESKKILSQVVMELDLASLLAERYDFPYLSEEDAYRLLRSKLGVSDRPGTSLIDISVTIKEDPALAARIANTIAATYERDRAAFAVSGQTATIANYNKQLREQEEAYREARDRVEELRKSLDLAGVNFSNTNFTIQEETLRQMERQLVEMQMQRTMVRTRWEQFKQVPLEQRFKLVNNQLVKDPTIQRILEAYLIADQKFATMKTRLGENHPDLITTESNLQKMRSQLEELLDGHERSLYITYLEWDAQISELEQDLERARAAQIEQASEKMRPFEDAVNRLAWEQKLLQTFEAAVRQAELDYKVPKRNVEILSTAEEPRSAHRPSLFLNLVLALTVGSVFSLGCAFLLEFFDTTFRSMEDMETKLQLPILGVVSRKLIHVTRDNYESFEAEPYRVIQTNVELARGDDAGNVIVVQSAGPGEGKSTTLNNIAAVMANAGQRVLVIDSDLRRPSQHKLFEKERNPGLIDYLTGAKPFDDIVQKTATKGLDFVASGQSNTFSLSILHNQRMDTLLDEIRPRYDKIFLDSPPIVGISDASVLASKADAVLMIVEHRRNPQSMVMRAKHIIESVGGTILGVVLNQVPESGTEDYNYYTSNYYYYGERNGGGRQKASNRRRSKGQVIENDVETLEFEESERRR